MFSRQFSSYHELRTRLSNLNNYRPNTQSYIFAFDTFLSFFEPTPLRPSLVLLCIEILARDDSHKSYDLNYLKAVAGLSASLIYQGRTHVYEILTPHYFELPNAMNYGLKVFHRIGGALYIPTAVNFLELIGSKYPILFDHIDAMSALILFAFSNPDAFSIDPNILTLACVKYYFSLHEQNIELTEFEDVDYEQHADEFHFLLKLSPYTKLHKHLPSDLLEKIEAYEPYDESTQIVNEIVKHVKKSRRSVTSKIDQKQLETQGLKIA